MEGRQQHHHHVRVGGRDGREGGGGVLVDLTFLFALLLSCVFNAGLVAHAFLIYIRIVSLLLRTPLHFSLPYVSRV